MFEVGCTDDVGVRVVVQRSSISGVTRARPRYGRFGSSLCARGRTYRAGRPAATGHAHTRLPDANVVRPRGRYLIGPGIPAGFLPATRDDLVVTGRVTTQARRQGAGDDLDGCLNFGQGPA